MKDSSIYTHLKRKCETENYQVGGDHYRNMVIQPWEVMESCMSFEEFVGFLRGNVLKYLMRCNSKGGRQDLEKAQHYLTKLIEILKLNE